MKNQKIKSYSSSRTYKKNVRKKVLLTCAAIILSMFVVFPLIWLFFNSFKPKIEIFNVPPVLLPENPTINNYIQLFDYTNIIIYFKNSFIVSIFSSILAILISVLGVYSLSRFKTKFNNSIFLLLIISYMMPQIILVIPFMKFWLSVGMSNSLVALTIIYTSITLPFSVWMLRSYIESIPLSLEEAAMVDGSTRFGAFLRIIIPAAAPGIAATFIFTFILAWNEYLYSLIMITTDTKKTLTLGIANLVGQKAIYSWGVLSAATVVSIVPILIFFIFIQKQLVGGFTAGAIKG